jgi:hypothetical protein
MVQFTSLNITGGDQKPLANLFQRQDQPTHRLALILPGLGYNVDMPLLYYAARLLVERHFDVLQLRPNYQEQAFVHAPQAERLERFYADTSAALHTGRAQGDYSQKVLLGKSIGSISLALLLNEEEDLGQPVTVWITPLLCETLVMEAALACPAPSFFMAGTADSSFDPAALKYIQKKTGAQAWLAENANHSLELPGDPLGSISLLAEGMHALSAFLDQAL